MILVNPLQTERKMIATYRMPIPCIRNETSDESSAKGRLVPVTTYLSLHTIPVTQLWKVFRSTAHRKRGGMLSFIGFLY